MDAYFKHWSDVAGIARGIAASADATSPADAALEFWGNDEDNDMTDLEISKALALAIGWKQVLTSVAADTCYVKFGLEKTWRVFGYRDPAVIWPIAEQFDCFPYKVSNILEYRWCSEKSEIDAHYADTPEKAVALAVIGGAQ